MVDSCLATQECHTVIEGIREHTIADSHLAIVSPQAKAFTVMNYRIGEHNSGGVAVQCIHGITNHTICELATTSLCLHRNTFPLTTDTVIWQIIEHMVQTVATKRYILSN